STSKYASAQLPAPIDAIVIGLSEPPRILIFAFAESHTRVTVTLVVATLLQTRVPTGKNVGPVVGLLLSRPMMFHVIGVTVNVTAVCPDRGNTKAEGTATASRNRCTLMALPVAAAGHGAR